MKTFRVYLVVVAAAILLLSACAGAPTAAPVPPTSAPAQATATSAPAQATVAPAQATATSAPAAYKPTIRPAQKRWQIGYGDGYGGIPFTDSVTKSINDTAAKMGVDISYCNYGADEQKTMACADNFITMKVDGVIEANWVPGMAAALSKKYKDAGIPMVAYDGPQPDAVSFGADNYTAGLVAGQYLGQFAKDKGWDPTQVYLIISVIQDQAVTVQRGQGARDGVTSVIDVPAGNIFQIRSGNGGVAGADMRDWLTAHPQAKYVLGFSESDSHALEMATELETAGLLQTSALAGNGGSDEALTDFHKRTDVQSNFKATVAYFPEHYGEYLVPIIVDLLEGKPVPPNVYGNGLVLDRSNVDQYYPAK